MDKNQKYVIVLLLTAIVFVVAQFTKNNYLFAVAMPLLLFTWLFAGAARGGKVHGVQKVWWVISFIIMVGSLIAMLNITSVPENITKSHLFGYPLPTGIMFFVYWLVLIVTGTLTFCFRFEKDYLRDEWIKEFEEKTGAKLLPDSNNVSKGVGANESTFSK
ncbi:MAG: hypothetical protein VB130_10265 [Clostridium sp.]|nr:hypothetical protein [Clostridium sp.]